MNAYIARQTASIIRSRVPLDNSLLSLSFGIALLAFLCLAPTVPGAVTLTPFLLVLISAAGIIKHRNPQDTHQRIIVIGILLFFGGAILSLPGNENWDFGQWRLEKYALGLMTLAILRFASRPSNHFEQALLWGLVPATLILATLALWQTAGAPASVRAGLGVDFNPNRFGTVAFSYAVLALAALCTLRLQRLERALLVAAVAASTVAGVASGSRGALAGLLAALPVLIFWRRQTSLSRKLAITAALSLAMTIAIAGLIWLSPFWATQLGRIFNEISAWYSGAEGSTLTSVGIRLELWRGAVHVWLANPLFGTGIGDVKDDIYRLIGEGVIHLHKSYARLHGMYFDALAGTGLIGITTMILGLFVIPWTYANRVLITARHDEWARFSAVAVQAWIAYYAVCGLSSSWVFNRGALPFFVPMMILLAGCSRAVNHSGESVNSARTAN